jgi:ABC-type glycerol-3-phosphate transport system substrate-binding protein
MARDRVVRVYQENWWPFQNLPAALARFTEQTGIRTELAWDLVGVGSIEKMFEEMLHSFIDDDPPFDLICTDEVMLRKFAAEGRVLALDELMAQSGIRLDDVTEATRDAIRFEGQTLGLPCINVSNMLLFRRDLLERYDLPVPQTWTELRDVGSRLQDAVRRDGQSEFYGFATRGAPGGGHAVWTISSFMASFGATWFDQAGVPDLTSEAHEAALATYVDLLRAVAPPDQAAISFVELLRDFRAGRVGMILEVGMEYAHLFGSDPALAAKSGVALIPAGPAGRFANLYSPPYAIPRNSKVREEAFALATHLCAPAQLLDDGLKANALETAPLPVLFSPEFDRHFRADLLAVARATRAIAFEHRPFSTLGIDACTIVGDHTTKALTGDLDVPGALRAMETGLRAAI